MLVILLHFIDKDVNSRCVLNDVSKSKNIPLQQKRNSNKTQNRNWRRQLLSLKLLYSIYQFSSHALFCHKKGRGNFFLKNRSSIFFKSPHLFCDTTEHIYDRKVPNLEFWLMDMCLHLLNLIWNSNGILLILCCHQGRATVETRCIST